jgi:hypothetical protein
MLSLLLSKYLGVEFLCQVIFFDTLAHWLQVSSSIGTQCTKGTAALFLGPQSLIRFEFCLCLLAM